MVQGVDQAVDLLIGRSRLLLDIVALAPVQQTTDAARPGVLADARAPGPSAVKRDVDTGSIELRGQAAVVAQRIVRALTGAAPPASYPHGAPSRSRAASARMTGRPA